MADRRRVWVTEVHNFGGFFGGDTVTLSAVAWPDGEEEMLTIDERALENVVTRHRITPDMLLELECNGDRIDRARLIGARTRSQLHEALPSDPPAALDAPRIRAYHCDHCDVWMAGEPIVEQDQQRCANCQQALV